MLPGKVNGKRGEIKSPIIHMPKIKANCKSIFIMKDYISKIKEIADIIPI